ncbi:MAG: hypothetical protein JRF02_07155 [Deltaproteobacteria bacterium]|nr:hypothetical protein [Deltaproteobacteria bacterium]
MGSINYYQDAYQKGFDDGKRTGGKINKTYIDNFLKEATQNLSTKDSSKFKKGWQDGFVDGVREALNNIVKDEGLLIKKLYNLDKY